MSACRLFLLGLLLPVLSSCTGLEIKPLLGQTLQLPASDFGPESLSAPLLGANAGQKTVVVYLGLSEKQIEARHPSSQFCHVPVVKGIQHLNRNVAGLPRDPAHAELRSRLITTRSRLMDYYDTRRIAFNSVPPFTGRGFMSRRAMMPPLGTTR
ncbi:MAG: hypothetical protein CJBNEKGG_01960 [Prosthecobacter sp.]|nr:hypothetical protein [Prosthecobacter sp.]